MTDFSGYDRLFDNHLVHKWTVSLFREQNEKIEAMIERMLVDDSGRGIILVRRVVRNGEVNIGLKLEDGVPYGHIFEFPDEAALREWRERGRPT